MKQIICTTIFSALLCSILFAQPEGRPNCTLTVNVKSLQQKPGKLFLSYNNAATGTTETDSVEITGENKISFKRALEEPTLALLRYVPNKIAGKPMMMAEKYAYSIYLEPGKIKVSVRDSMSNAFVKGSVSHDYYQKLLALKKPFDLKQREILTNYSPETANKKLPQYQAVGKEIKEKVYKPYVIEYGQKTPVTLFALKEYAGKGDLQFKEVEPLFLKIAAQYRSLPSGVAMAENIDIAKRTHIGALAPDFTQNDTLDKPVSLSSFRGKYVLVDFWASWCGPCRGENPNLIKSYNRFKDKGFTVLGVSLDLPGKKHLWMKAIHEDQLPWTQVSDLALWNNAAAKLYGIKAIPSNVLIDPDGIIVAKNLRGEFLNKKLEELLGR